MYKYAFKSIYLFHGLLHLTKTRYIKTPSFSLVAQWILDSGKLIPNYLVKRSLVQCVFYNVVERIENDTIFEQSDNQD